MTVSKINEWVAGSLNSTEIRELLRTHALDKTGDDITGIVTCPTPNKDSNNEQIINKQYHQNALPTAGTYKGTDETNKIVGQTIHLGFRPACIIISSNTHAHVGAATPATYVIINNGNGVTILEDGFSVKCQQYSHASSIEYVSGANKKDVTYTYIAFKEVNK